MGAAQESNNLALSTGFPTLKVTAMEETLSQAVKNFRDLVLELEQLHLTNINYRKAFHEQKDKLENETCSSCNDLKKVIAAKEQIIDSIASVLYKLTQTKDFNLVEVILKQIYGHTIIFTPQKSVSPQKENNQMFILAKENMFESSFKSPKKEVELLESKDESVSEIEGTPTGRKSPIFQSKKTKTSMSLKNSSSLKDKKKCPDSWPTPEKKAIKLLYPSSTQSKSVTRMRQGRLSFIKVKSCNVVDLTCSPENRGEIDYIDNNIQCKVKKEAIDNDETILPSPTSGPVKFPVLYKSMASDSPTKFRKPLTTTKCKIEVDTTDHDVESKHVINENGKHMEDSINLLNQFSNRFKSPKKIEKIQDETHCGDESISLLQHNVKKVDTKSNIKQIDGPSKRPLVENVNIMNIQNHKNEPDMSILQRDPGTSKPVKADDDFVKRLKSNVAPVYKVPAVRKKAEKWALPGWSCDECRIFYDELYKDDPEMLAQKMDECSKHRGRTNPVRPKTPDGFWNPRWDVPQDTEEFNRRNNAV